MNCMFGDALCTPLKRTCTRARSYLGGSLGPIAPSNMGLSDKHASTVPLVLNLDSGYIHRQFNIVFDYWFAAVAASLESLLDLNSLDWSKMFRESTFQFSFDGDDDSDSDE